MNGWIKLHRKILENPIFTSKDAYLAQLWIYLLLSVNHKSKRFLFNGEEISLEAGQGVFGLNQIVKDCKGLQREKTPKFRKYKTIYYRKLKLLEKIGNVKLQPTNKFTIITIPNWDKYQSDETQLKLNRNSTETQLKTNKKDKNEKNNIAFIKFWDLYDKKLDRPKCELKWEKLSDEIQQKILDYLPEYKKTTPDKKFRKNPATFLNNHSWENELVAPKEKQQGKW